MSAREPRILRPSELPATARGGGVSSIPLVTRKTGSTAFMNGITIFPPGGSVPLHKHNCDESVLLLQGSAVAEIAGEDYAICAGDVSFIPEGVHHRFRNASDEHEMKILWTYASVDADRTIIATGETRRIDDEHAVAPD